MRGVGLDGMPMDEADAVTEVAAPEDDASEIAVIDALPKWARELYREQPFPHSVESFAVAVRSGVMRMDNARQMIATNNQRFREYLRKKDIEAGIRF